jgi:hypothetical protein
VKAFAVAAALLFAGVLAARAPGAPDSWPREFTTAKGSRIVIYQPQAETFGGDTITGRAAVSVTRRRATSPRFGVVFFSARVSVDRSARTVSILDVAVRRVRFPNITPERERRFAAILEEEIPKWRLVGSYDRLLESLKVAERERRSAAGLRNDPPRILFAREPSVLLLFDGEPRLRDVEEGGPWKIAVNTPFFVALDSRTGAWYLAGGSRWWYRTSEPRGPWTPISAPPADLAAIAVPPDAPPDGTEESAPPKIVVSTEPAELVVSEGDPTFTPIDGLDILRMDNTESDVLMDVSSQRYFLLLAGRWYVAPSLSSDGWTFVPPDALPREFSKIPPDSAAGGVLASIPGTDEAEDAALDAWIPETAAVRRDRAAPEVRYDGAPDFVTIAGTRVRYAANASIPVLEIEGRWFACDAGVWFVSNSPSGPWVVADAIPEEDIQAIPPDAPVYPVRFVSIYRATPEYVYVGYTPGYLGCLVGDWGTIVWGTGWYYPPWIGPGGYWGWPWTWGWGARYSWDGWSFGISWTFPFFDTGISWWEGHGGGRRHHGRWWGAGGYRPPVSLVPRTAPPTVSRPAGPGKRPLEPRPGGPRVRPIPSPRPPHPVLGFRPGRAAILRERPRGLYDGLPGSGRPPTPSRPLPGKANDVFASPDGNVFRRTGDGRWQESNGHGWKAPSPPASPAPSRPPVVRPAPPAQLERDFSARQRGEARAPRTMPASPAPRPAAPPSRPAPPPKRPRR